MRKNIDFKLHQYLKPTLLLLTINHLFIILKLNLDLIVQIKII